MEHVSIILLTLPDGKIVFQRRTKDAPASPSMLGFFGGQVEHGESYDDGILRELGEETSLDIKSLQWGFVQEFTPTEGSDRNAVFHLYWSEIPNADFEVFEGDGAEVYTRKEALERDDLALVTRYILEEILKEKK